MTIILVIILALWVLNLSGRVSALERRLKQGVEPAAATRPSLAEVSAFPQVSVAPKPPLSDHDRIVDDQSTANWLNRIGVLALLVGMVFFYLYAVDQGWIKEWMRIAVGSVVGGLLVYLGYLWKEKYGTKAHALSGGGIGLLYFTVFAAQEYYSLISQAAGFVFYLAIAGLAVWLSYKYKSLALGFLGFFGAYGAPLIFGGRDQQVALFAYLTILNVAVVAILAKRYWAELLALAVIGTAFDFGIWAARSSTLENTFTSLYFVILTTLLYAFSAAILARHHARMVNDEADRNTGLAHLLSGAFFFISITALLRTKFPDLLPAIAALGGIAYLIVYAIADRLEFKLTNYASSLVASWLLVFAIIWQWDGIAVAAYFLILGFIGITVGVLLNREELRVWSVAVIFMSLVQGVVQPYGREDMNLLFNRKFGLMLAQVAGLLYAGWLYAKVEMQEVEQNAGDLLYLASSILLWWAGTSEIAHYFRGNAQNLYLSLWWMIYAVFLLVMSGVLKNILYRKFAVALFALSIVKVFVYDSQALDTGYRVVAFIVLGVILLSVSFVYQKNKEKITEFIEGEKSDANMRIARE